MTGRVVKFKPFNPFEPGETLQIAQATAGQQAFTEEVPAVAGQRSLSREFPRHQDERLDNALRRLEMLENGRSSLGSRRWAEITEAVNEYNYSALGTATVVQGTTYYAIKSNDPATGGRYSGFATITAYVVTVPSSQTGLLQLGDFNLPVGQGVTNSPPGMNLQLATDDIRQLLCTGSGPMSIAIFGHVSPMTGTLPI